MRLRIRRVLSWVVAPLRRNNLVRNGVESNGVGVVALTFSPSFTTLGAVIDREIIVLGCSVGGSVHYPTIVCE